MPPLDALVLDATLRQSLVAVRSLGRRGLSVAAVDTLPNVPAFWSRWCRRGYLCPHEVATEGYLAYVEQLADTPGARVLISSHDGTIAVLRRHRDRLERRVRLALASEAALSIAVNKERTLAVASQLEIPIPRTLRLKSTADLRPALDEIGLPAVVKPSESWLADDVSGIWVGPELVTTTDEACRAVGEICRRGGDALLQTLLSGRREAVSFLYANGTIHARFAQWARRTRPPLGGESVLRQSIRIPEDIGVAAERLVREIDLEGYSEVEFRRDGAGTPYLMEVNSRLSASVDIAVRSGVDFPHLLWQWASGSRITPVGQYRAGGWMRYLQGDVMTTIAAFQERGRPGVTPPVRAAIGFGAAFLQPMSYDYFDWADPLPAVKAMADFTGEFTRGSVRAAWRRVVAPGRRAVPAREE